jgi:hypothetical protein
VIFLFHLRISKWILFSYWFSQTCLKGNLYKIIYTKSKMAQTYLMDYCKTYLPPIKALKMFHILLLQSSSKPTCRKPGTGKTGFFHFIYFFKLHYKTYACYKINMHDLFCHIVFLALKYKLYCNNRFFTCLPESKILKIISIYLNKFFHNFHL